MRIIRFSAVWCPGCLVMKSRWKYVLSVYPDLDITNYDYDMDNEMVIKYDIGKILPVVIFLDGDNHEIKRVIGEIEKDKLVSEIKALKGSNYEKDI